MFCPVCGAEYVGSITRCPEDDVDLVEDLPHHRPEGSRHARSRRQVRPRDAIVVHRLTAQAQLGEPRAKFIRTALEENGIPVVISGEFAFPNSIYGTALGPPTLEVLVSRADAERAREIIAEVEQSLALDSSPGADEEDGEENDDEEGEKP